MVSNSNNIKKNEQSPLISKSMNTKFITTHNVGNPGIGLRQAQKCVGGKPVN